MAEPSSVTLRCAGACTACIELESLSATVETLKQLIGEKMGTLPPPQLRTLLRAGSSFELSTAERRRRPAASAGTDAGSVKVIHSGRNLLVRASSCCLDFVRAAIVGPALGMHLQHSHGM